MCLNEGVAYENAVFLGDEDFLFCEDNATHAVGHAWHTLAVELTDILVAVGRIHTAAVAVNAQIERRPVLNNRLVEARKKHMVLSAHRIDWNNQQAVLLARVAAHQCGAVVGSGTVGAQHFLGERLVQVDEKVLIKL